MFRFRKYEGAAKEPPQEIRKVLRDQYRLYTPELFSMSYVEKPIKYEGKRVKHFKIYGLPQSSYAEPESRESALFFEGRIDRDGGIHVVDCRPSHLVAR